MIIIRYNLGKITEVLKSRLSVIVDTNKVSSFRGREINQATIIKTNYHNIMYNINMYPYITLDFTNYDDKLEAINAGVGISDACKIKLNKQAIYLMIRILDKMEKDFIVNKDLYYYSNGKLILNKQKAEAISVKRELGDKVVLINPCIIEIGGGEKEHEGIALSLNDLAYTTYLTYTEMGYLKYILEKTDIDLLAVELIKMVGENKIVSMVNNTVISIDGAGTTITKPEEYDNSSTNNILIPKEENVIPNL